MTTALQLHLISLYLVLFYFINPLDYDQHLQYRLSHKNLGFKESMWQFLSSHSNIAQAIFILLCEKVIYHSHSVTTGAVCQYLTGDSCIFCLLNILFDRWRGGESINCRDLKL